MQSSTKPRASRQRAISPHQLELLDWCAPSLPAEPLINIAALKIAQRFGLSLPVARVIASSAGLGPQEAMHG